MKPNGRIPYYQLSIALHVINTRRTYKRDIYDVLVRARGYAKRTTITAMAQRAENGVGRGKGRLNPDDAKWLVWVTDREVGKRNNPVRKLLMPMIRTYRKSLKEK